MHLPEPKSPPELTESDLQVARDALTGRPSWMELHGALEPEADRLSSEALRILSAAFVYDLIAGADSERRHTAGSPYASMFETDEGSYPPRPANLDPVVKQIWEEAGEALDDPIAQARLGDLLYVADGKRAYQHGLAGAAAHVQLASEPKWSALDRAESMARALEVYAELNNKPALADAAERAVELAEEFLGQEYPGPPFIVVRALIALKPERRPAGLDALMERLAERFAGSPAGESALELASEAATDPQRRQDLRRRQLQARIDAADTADGLGEVTFLQRAIELARRYGFSEEAQELLKRQQDLPHEALGFQTFETEVEVPRDEIDAQVDLYAGTGATDLFNALNRIGQFGPHGGSNADLDLEIEQENKEFPLLGLFGHSLFESSSSTPTFLANDEESKRRLSRGQRRQLHCEFYGRFLVGPMLEHALETHGRPSHEELATHFATDLIGPELGERLARALELFWDGEYDESAHVLAPRLEAVLRQLAREEGLVVVKPADEARYGGVVSLNHVMSKLRELNSANSWLDYLEALLCDPLALNLRNAIAHGLAGRVGGVHAALLVQAGCHLALLRKAEPDTDLRRDGSI